MALAALFVILILCIAALNKAVNGETMRSGVCFALAIPFILVGVAAGFIAYILIHKLGGNPDELQDNGD